MFITIAKLGSGFTAILYETKIDKIAVNHLPDCQEIFTLEGDNPEILAFEAEKFALAIGIQKITNLGGNIMLPM